MSERNNKIPFNEDNYTHNIERNNERKLDRRGFMKTLVGLCRRICGVLPSLGAVVAKELMGLGEKEYPHKKITEVSKPPIGDAVEFKFPGDHDDAILIRLSENKYVAYQNACTHLRRGILGEGARRNDMPLPPREVRCGNRCANSGTAKKAASGNTG